jgi:hypothetical protein
LVQFYDKNQGKIKSLKIGKISHTKKSVEIACLL